MALGIGENISQTIILIIALASHKWIEAFAFSTRSLALFFTASEL